MASTYNEQRPTNQSAALQPEVSDDDDDDEEEADDMWHIPSPAASFKHRSTLPGSGALACKQPVVSHRISFPS